MQRRAETSILRRLRFITGVFGVVCFLAITVKLFMIQVVEHEYYQQMAVEQQTKDQIIYPRRGVIYDVNMLPLAISADTEMVTLEQVKIEDEEQGLLIAAELARILEMDEAELIKKVETKSSYTVIKRGLEKDIADQVRKFISEYNINEAQKAKDAKAAGSKYTPKTIDSVFLRPDTTRRYPYGNFLSHVLGFVGTDEGLYGLEFQYENVLKGTPGRIVSATNGKGGALPEEYEMQYDAVDGNSLVLTIDKVLQHYLEKNIEIAYNDNKVQQYTEAIVMDVNTGGILAMAVYPDFDPNEPFTIVDEELAAEIAAIEDKAEYSAARSDALNAQWRNNTISDTYYAGSTFKIITAAIGLEEKAVTVGSQFYCTGSKHVGIHDIGCWKYGGHGSLSMVEAVQKSCNPAFMEIGEAIGWDTMVKYHNAFGLGNKTGIDLPGEASGSWFAGSTRDQERVNLAVGSFGQNFPITPLQLITAVSAVANGGTLLTPHVVKEIIDSEGNIIESFGRKEVRQVISKETSDLMNSILESVVTVGTGKNAYTAGYRIAGKTGTTEKIGLVEGGKDKRISSFIAYAPADNPQIAVLILLDEPSVQPVTGGITVAPVIRRFMEEALPYLNVEARYTEEELKSKDVVVPDISGLTRAEAETLLTNSGLSFRTSGAGDIVTGQVPAAGATVSNTSQVIMYMGTEVPAQMITMPDLYGMTLEKAKNTLGNIGLYMRVAGLTNSSEGHIVVTRQSVEKDAQVSFGEVVTIELADLDQRVE